MGKSEQRGPGTVCEGEAPPGARQVPREMPVSLRGARAGSAWHLPGAAGGGRRLASGVRSGQVWEANQRCRPSELACRRARAGGRREPGGRPGAGAAPGAPSQQREPASCWFMLRAPGPRLHCSEREPIPVTSAFYSPEMCHREMGLVKGMPAVGEQRRLWNKEGRENGPLAPLQSRAPALTPLLLQVCAWGLAARAGP